jgi:hypothetical protein
MIAGEIQDVAEAGLFRPGRRDATTHESRNAKSTARSIRRASWGILLEKPEFMLHRSNLFRIL